MVPMEYKTHLLLCCITKTTYLIPINNCVNSEYLNQLSSFYYVNTCSVNIGCILVTGANGFKRKLFHIACDLKNLYTTNIFVNLNVNVKAKFNYG